VKTARLRPAVDLDHLEEAFLRIKPVPAAVLPADPASLSPSGPNADAQAGP